MLHKRGNIWHVCIYRRGQKPIRCSAETTDRDKAQEFHDRLADASWRERKLKERPRKLWEEAVVSYLKHVRKRSVQDDVEMLRWLDSRLHGFPLDVIAGVGDEGFSEKWDSVLEEKKKEGVSDARLNRYTSLVKTILRRNGLVPKLRTYPESPRERTFTEEEVTAMISAIPQWATDPFLFDLGTGLRKGNLLGLKWDWIKMDRRVIEIPGENFKNGRPVEIPLSAFAIDILKRQLGKHSEYVFVRDGRPITEDAWRWMWDKVRPKNCRFHDVRRTWATWLRHKGASLGDIKDSGGWKTLAIVEKTYAKVRPAQLISVVDLLELHKFIPHQRTEVVQVGAGKGI